MKRHLSAALLAVSLCACAPAFLSAATITFLVDGQAVDVPNYWAHNPTTGRGEYHIGDPAKPDQPWVWQNAEGGISLLGALDPDPSLMFNGTVTDFGAPSNFGFIFSMPLAPLVPNPSTVFDSLAGSATNGSVNDGGVTITALAPPMGIPVDGDGVTEIQVFTLSDDNGLTWKNVGLDSGPTTTIPLGPFASGLYPASNQGPVLNPLIGGPWTNMRADINFGLSGGGDTFSFNGAKVLEPVPEPATGILLLVAAALLGSLRRRS
jgi:hypothetical protein